MSFEFTYILSQIFTVINYILLAMTYYVKARKRILIISFMSLLANAIAYILLNAWTGVAMCLVALIRNIIFLIDEHKNKQANKITKKDIIILIILYIISIISAIFTFEGYLSLLSVFATMLYTYSVWQKNPKTYKLLGIPVGILWILYNLYVKSIFGIILESVLLVCSTSGYILVKKRK